MKRWYRKSTITRELLHRGWKKMNSAPDWDAFTLDAVTLQLFWGDKTHVFKLEARNRKHPDIHFRAYDLQLTEPRDFELLAEQVRRLKVLVELDTDGP